MSSSSSNSLPQPALHALNRALLDYWLSKRRDDGLPRESEIDPTEIPQLLPDLIVYERIEPDHFRVRIVGQRVVMRIGVDPTGANIFEVFSERFKSNVMAAMNRVLDEPCAQLTTVRDRFPSGREGLVEVLRLPLADDKGQLRYIISSTAELQPPLAEVSPEPPSLLAEPVENLFLTLNALQTG
ncbi:PAS domain-containing protein [Algihabitans albus]|uniref:PAS domain-containing protein n=1 Tax=Algihabitans albus TaxID=2164067 RepID=UPI0013C371D6|nr:PAS domain-containing protein [Algihabitans albus]